MTTETKPSWSEKLAAWNKENKEWNEKYNAYMKIHPKPPPSEAEAAWQKEYEAFLEKHPKPPMSEALVAWHKIMSDFHRRHPIPRYPIPSPPPKPQSKALVPFIPKFDLDSLIPAQQSKSLSIFDYGNQAIVHHMQQPEPLSVYDLDSQSLITHNHSQAVVLHKQGNTLNQKYIGAASEVLLLGDSTMYANSGEIVPTTYINVDDEKTKGSSLGSINTKANSGVTTAQTNLDSEDAKWRCSVSMDHHRKKPKKSATGAYNIAPIAQTTNFDDDVYEILRPKNKKPIKVKGEKIRI